MTYLGLRPGEKLFEELLMAEEGMQETPNKLIHIGKPIEMDDVAFKKKPRMERQKQYLVNFMGQAVKAMKADMGLPVSLYQSLTDDMVTNLRENRRDHKTAGKGGRSGDRGHTAGRDFVGCGNACFLRGRRCFCCKTGFC